MQTVTKQQLNKQINDLLLEIKNPKVYQQHLTLYNDVLLLKTIIANVPESYNSELALEFKNISDAVKASGNKGIFGKFFRSSDSVTVQKITKHLKTVEKKDVLLQDFIVINSKGKRQLK